MCAIRLGFFLVQMSCSLLDLFAITGYKFVGLAINMVIGYLFGKVSNKRGGEERGVDEPRGSSAGLQGPPEMVTHPTT